MLLTGAAEATMIVDFEDWAGGDNGFASIALAPGDSSSLYPLVIGGHSLFLRVSVVLTRLVREGQPAGSGPALPRARAGGGSPVRGPGGGAPAARRGGRTSRHGRRLRESHTGLTCHTRHGGDIT